MKAKNRIRVSGRVERGLILRGFDQKNFSLRVRPLLIGHLSISENAVVD